MKSDVANSDGEEYQTEKKIDYRDAILKLSQSPEYRELRGYYDRKSSFSILGIARQELRHSNMIAWFLSPKSGHGLGKNPMRHFLQLLAIAKMRYEVNDKGYLPNDLLDRFVVGNYDIEDIKIEKEVSITDTEHQQDKYGRVDFLLKVHMTINNERKVLPIVIENKIESDEHFVRSCHKMQTVAYYEWAMRTFTDSTKYIQPLFVFLTADGSYALETGNKKVKHCESPEFLRINYQGLVDHVIAPCLKEDMRDEIRYFINDYLRCLSFEALTPDERKSSMIMSLAPYEKELLHAFWEKNEDLLLAAMYALSEDTSIDLKPDVREKMHDVSVSVQQRDRTKYKIGTDGEILPQGRMVLEVVKKYVSENRELNLQKLMQVFPDDLAGKCRKFGVVRKLEPSMEGAKLKRYFLAENEKITLDDGTIVVVSREWGRDYGKGNIPAFVAKAKELGYDIREV